MDVTEFAESDYVTAALIRESKTKKAIILGEGKKEQVEFQGVKTKKLSIPIEIDGQNKTYRPNRDSVKNIIGSLGAENKAWLGKTLLFSVISAMGKDSVIAVVQK